MSKRNLNKNENPFISIIAGSTSDKEVYEKAEKVLKENNIGYDLQILSAHRNLEELDKYIKSCEALIMVLLEGARSAEPPIKVGTLSAKAFST